MGQAVLRTRERGGDMLSAALSPGEPGEAYLRSCGFAPAGETPEGRTLWQACIGFDPLV